MVVEFCHIRTLMNKPQTFEDGIELAGYAETCSIPELMKLCSDELLANKVTMENAWRTFDKHHKKKVILEICQKFLSKNTEKLLEQPNFLKISMEALEKFLTFPEMNIESEMSLIKACLRHLSAKKEEEKELLFKKHILRHLRLLTVLPGELSGIAKWLTKDERFWLVKMENSAILDIANLKLDKENPNLCTETVARKAETLTQNFVTEDLTNVATLLDSGSYLFLQGAANKLVVAFEAKQSIMLQGVELFCPIDYLDQNLTDVRFKEENKGRVMHLLPDQVTVHLDIVHRGKMLLQRDIPREENKLYKMNAIELLKTYMFLPKGAQLNIEVTFKGKCCLRRVSGSKAMVNDSEVMEKVKLYHKRKELPLPGHVRGIENTFKPISNGNSLVPLGAIKAIHYALVR
ncbi:Hypothetical predicted protein [Cloeon dipterum]|nr:Hypothetical predicted protein [Cloeon dipterum]